MILAKNKKLAKARKGADTTGKIFIAILFLSFVVFLIFSDLKLRRRDQEVNAKIVKMKSEILILEKEKSNYLSKLSQRESGEYLEKEAREKYNLKKIGENLVIVVPRKTPPPLPAPQKIKKSFWRKILDFFELKL